jgi:hypothetical protein
MGIGNAKDMLVYIGKQKQQTTTTTTTTTTAYYNLRINDRRRGLVIVK